MTDVEQATSANWPLKRCFSIQESRHYLGLRRRVFEKHIAPLLEGKGTQVGVTVLFERADLDASLGGLQGICQWVVVGDCWGQTGDHPDAANEHAAAKLNARPSGRNIRGTGSAGAADAQEAQMTRLAGHTHEATSHPR